MSPRKASSPSANRARAGGGVGGTAMGGGGSHGLATGGPSAEGMADDRSAEGTTMAGGAGARGEQPARSDSATSPRATPDAAPLMSPSPPRRPRPLTERPREPVILHRAHQL